MEGGVPVNVTKLDPAPLPNGVKGGFLKMAGNKHAKVHEAEWKALEAKHEVDREKLKEKHRTQNAVKPTAKPKQ